MKSNLGIIIQREFMERVGKKSFIFTTLLMPLFMLLMMALPSLILIFSSPSEKTIAYEDKSGVVTKFLLQGNDEDIKFVKLTMPLDSAINNEAYDAVLTIPANIVDNPAGAVMYLHEGGSLETERYLGTLIEDAVRDQRMRRYDIANLQQIIDDTDVTVNIQTKRVDNEGEEESTSTMLSYGVGFFMVFLLYMFLLMYGQLVMTSIIEEKNNRVLELMVSSTKPMNLMLGKIFGVGLVSVVQILIWGVLLCVMAATVLPALLPANIAKEVSMFNAGTLTAEQATTDMDLIGVISTFSSVGYIAELFCYILVFLIGGFLFYASIFAAIGSSVDNAQDASQLTSFAVVPIIIGLVIGMSAGTDPNSSLAFWSSMIPFTSPMVMLMRIPFGIPAWEIWTSVALLYASFVVMVWIAAKIYRIGIFMYGKKPSVRDLVRWARYK